MWIDCQETNEYQVYMRGCLSYESYLLSLQHLNVTHTPLLLSLTHKHHTLLHAQIFYTHTVTLGADSRKCAFVPPNKNIVVAEDFYFGGVTTPPAK